MDIYEAIRLLGGVRRVAEAVFVTEGRVHYVRANHPHRLPESWDRRIYKALEKEYVKSLQRSEMLADALERRPRTL
jgi:hypothetical protein